MKKERLVYLIDQYCKGRASEKEQQELDDWYNQVDYGTQGLTELIITAGNSRALIDKLYENFKPRIKAHQARVRKIVRLTAIAASLLLLVTFGIVLNYLLKKQLPPITVTAPIVPGREQAVLTLANGQKIILDVQKAGTIFSQHGVSVSKNDGGQLVYTISAPQEAAGNTAYNSIETPRGGRYQVTLPDGTAIWLNAATKLTYPIRFSNTERRVQLSGEAYFEVAKDPKKPFIVHFSSPPSGGGGREGVVEVLGTHFNINAYGDEPTVRTTLLEGKVQVSGVGTQPQTTNYKPQTLLPGQQASLDHTTGSIQVNNVNTFQATSWKNGYFLFDDMDIKSIMKVISRWYDVDIIYGDVDPNETFGGSFSRDAALSEILQNLQSIGKVHFRITNRTIIVTN
jgi:transmembrane sensor